MDWTWDDRKAASNKAKHKVLFVTAAAAPLNDPLRVSADDPHADANRWQTIAMLDGVVLYVIHTEPEDGAPGRIISACLATRAERRIYGY